MAHSDKPTRYFHEIKLNLLYRRRPFDTYTQPVTEYFSIFLIPEQSDVFYAVPLSLSPPSSRNWLEMEVKTSCESWVSVGRDKRRRIKLSDVYCRLTRTRSIGSLYRAQAVKTWPLTLRFSIAAISRRCYLDVRISGLTIAIPVFRAVSR